MYISNLGIQTASTPLMAEDGLNLFFALPHFCSLAVFCWLLPNQRKYIERTSCGMATLSRLLFSTGILCFSLGAYMTTYIYLWDPNSINTPHAEDGLNLFFALLHFCSLAVFCWLLPNQRKYVEHTSCGMATLSRLLFSTGILCFSLGAYMTI